MVPIPRIDLRLIVGYNPHLMLNQLDREPQNYKFRHAKRISLEGYHGIAKDLMLLNDPVADGFMRVSDMREDIAVIRKPKDRVCEYDEIGSVRVAKFLKLPRMEFWHGDGMVETKREDGVWLLSVNDQELADRVARSNDGKKKFDDLYVNAFGKEVKRGLTSCLEREKLLNGQRYSTAFITGYMDLALNLTFLSLTILVAAVTKEVYDTASVGTSLASMGAFINTLNNSFNWSHTEKNPFSALSHLLARSRLPVDSDQFSDTIRYNDPFIKHSIWEFFLPSVPVDRLVRGLCYLNQHGQNLIKSAEENI